MSPDPSTATTIIPHTVLEAIRQRCSVRDYMPQVIDKSIIHTLLDAAVLAPTAMNQQPWAFIVIQDQSVLDRLSAATKALLHNAAKGSDTPESKHLLHLADNAKFDIFYNASTLIVICGKFTGPFVEADCWLAAENLMLTACANGLGTCVIGFAVEALNTPEWKTELMMPEGMTAIAPMIVGMPASDNLASKRKSPEILFWK